MAEERTEVVQWLYTGRRFGILKGGGMAHVYIDENNEERLFTKPLSKGVGKDIIGEVYEGMIIHKPDGGMAAAPNWKWIPDRRDSDGDKLVTQWQAEDEAAIANKRHEGRKKRAKEANSMYAVLDPIQTAYRKTNAVGRRAILAQVIEFIVR